MQVHDCSCDPVRTSEGRHLAKMLPQHGPAEQTAQSATILSHLCKAARQWLPRFSRGRFGTRRLDSTPTMRKCTCSLSSVCGPLSCIGQSLSGTSIFSGWISQEASVMIARIDRGTRVLELVQHKVPHRQSSPAYSEAVHDSHIIQVQPSLLALALYQELQDTSNPFCEIG